MSVSRFVQDEEGAVTLDWVVLTAGLMLLTIPMSLAFGSYIQTIVDLIRSKLLDSTVVPDLT